ncbi:MAG: hypothetical protein IT225_06350 [Flavobacteriales bacterium]|nr:hypothetical protein [Flavobacteriales bacterium]
MKPLHHFRKLASTLLLTITLVSNAQTILTNNDVMQMAELGMGEAIILSQIENSNNNFDVSTSALMVMKKAGLSDAVIAKVIVAGKNTAQKVVDPNDPLAPHRPGIYYFNDAGIMVELLPTVTSQNKDKGRLGTALSYGIAKTKLVSRITGDNSRTQLPSTPTFYFYFNQQTSAFDQNTIAYYGFQQATSPNEFTLAALDQVKGVRELETGSMNNYTSEFGIDEKHSRSFTIEQLAPGTYKVSPDALVNGEYCFVYSGAAPYAGTQQKVYDFGVGTVSATNVISRQ